MWLLFLFFVSSTALFSQYYDKFDSPSRSSSRHLSETPPLAPYQKDVPHPKTPEMMQERFKEDMIGMLTFRSRNHYDDLLVYIKPDAQIHSCFAPGRNLKVRQFEHMVMYIAGFYQKLTDIRMNAYSSGTNYVHGKFSYNATGSHGENVYGRWAYKATVDHSRQMFLINYILFAGDCNAIPMNVPSDPTEGVDHYIERVRVKLTNGLFLPDGEPQTPQNFEEFGEFISEDAQIFVCDEPKMDADGFIMYMIQRYHSIRKYKNNEFSYVKNEQYFELTFSTTWTAPNTTQFQDTYVFRVRKTEDYFPELNKNFYLWKIYWVTKKCAVDVTPEIDLISGSTQIAEVNKRFSDVIDGQNWDVFQSFLDLFDASRTVWGTCIGSRSQPYDKMQPYLTDVSMRYATAVVTKVEVHKLTSVDFTTTFLVSRANEVQEQEELEVTFSGYKDAKTNRWKMTRMYFECDER